MKLLFEAKFQKAFSHAMNLLQKITQAFEIKDDEVVVLVLQMLREASSEYLDEMTEIRILQMLLTFLDPQTMQLSKDFVNLVMVCCF